MKISLLGEVYVYQRFRKYDCFIGDGKSIKYIENVLKNYYEKD